MTQYIDKSAVVAEIERRIKEIEKTGTYLSPKGVLTNLLCSINTIEVKDMDEEYNGKAMLHVLEKGVKQGKRELIDKACEWLDDNLHHYWGSISADPHNFLFDFRKAMEE